MKQISELFYSLDGDTNNATLTDEFKEFIVDHIGYKGGRYLESEVGMKGLINVMYTADCLASKMGSNTVNVDGEVFNITDYKFPGGFKLAVRSGKLYTTSEARENDVKKYDVVKPSEDEIHLTYKKVEVTHAPKMVTPKAVESFFKYLFLDDPVDSMETLESKAVALTDYKVLKVGDSEYVVDFVSGAEIPEQVTALRGTKSPFSEAYDTTVEVVSKQEVLRWLLGK